MLIIKPCYCLKKRGGGVGGQPFPLQYATDNDILTILGVCSRRLNQPTVAS